MWNKHLQTFNQLDNLQELSCNSSQLTSIGQVFARFCCIKKTGSLSNIIRGSEVYLHPIFLNWSTLQGQLTEFHCYEQRKIFHLHGKSMVQKVDSIFIYYSCLVTCKYIQAETNCTVNVMLIGLVLLQSVRSVAMTAKGLECEWLFSLLCLSNTKLLTINLAITMTSYIAQAVKFP